jgi:hypothetical protein
MASGTGGRGRSARALAVCAGLDAGLGWVPAAGVSARFAAVAVVVALLVVATGHPAEPAPAAAAGAPARPRGAGFDPASRCALALAALASAGAALAPPDFAPRPARTEWLALALLAVGALLVEVARHPLGRPAPPRTALVAVTGPRRHRCD